MKNILSKFENYRVCIYGGVCVYIYIYYNPAIKIKTIELNNNIFVNIKYKHK